MRDEELFTRLRASQTEPPEADEAFFARLEGDVARAVDRLEARAHRRVPRWTLVSGGLALAAAAALVLVLRPHPGPGSERRPARLTPAEEALIDVGGEDATELVDELDTEELRAVDVHWKEGA